jgi:cobalt-zinc-cadmium efflux system outer membrane protein
MSRMTLRGLVVVLVLAGLAARRAQAQEAEELLPTITSLPGGREPGVTSLGRSPGAGGLLFENVPGFGEPLLGGGPGPAFPRVPAGIMRAGAGMRIPAGRAIGLPAAAPLGQAPVYGPLEVPAGADEDGPPSGLTLDQAVERLVRDNLDLRARFHEIPKAQADILSAGLRANPLLFFDAQRVPYGNAGRASSPQGISTEYDLNINHPLDLSGKRRARMDVACRAKRVLEAQYQDAVRIELDNLYTVFANVLGERETVRYARASIAGLEAVLETTRAQLANQAITEADYLQVKNQLAAAEIGLLDAEEALRDATRTLGGLLSIPPAEAELMELRGTIHDRAPPPPAIDELTRTALENRPDLAAFQLGVQRAWADIRLAKASRLQDVYLLYQPYTREGGATSWALGATVPLPVYNRNQGLIARARINVSQVTTELEALQQKVVLEARKAEREYLLTRAAVERVERELVPDARRVRDTVRQQFSLGEVDALAFLNAQRSYNEIVHQYRDTLIRHRRSMLRLNTVVGARILP